MAQLLGNTRYCNMWQTSSPPAVATAAIAAMLAGSVVGLLAYVLIAPYCAAVFSAGVSAVVMLIGSRTWPERFDFTLLQEEG